MGTGAANGGRRTRKLEKKNLEKAPKKSPNLMGKNLPRTGPETENTKGDFRLRKSPFLLFSFGTWFIRSSIRRERFRPFPRLPPAPAEEAPPSAEKRAA
jgi:hypothetical protein